MVTIDLLSQIDLFEGLSTAQLETIADLCQEKSCAGGETLFREGEKAGWLYFLLEGEITIYVQLSSRPERLTVTVISEPGQALGWSGIVAPHRYTASAVCETDSRLLALEGQALMDVLKQDPATGFVVIQRIAEVISRRLRNTRVALLKTL